MKRIILWMLVFTGLMYAFIGLHNSSEQERINKEEKQETDTLNYSDEDVKWVGDNGVVFWE